MQFMELDVMCVPRMTTVALTRREQLLLLPDCPFPCDSEREKIRFHKWTTRKAIQ